MKILKHIVLVLIAVGLYLGIRYLGALVHYASANPAEDGPPPIVLAGNLAFYLTGGTLIPLFLQDSPYIK
jgi:hypothetical protein